MITLKEIADRLETKTEDTRKATWNPQTVDDYTLPEFNIYESTARGAKTLLKRNSVRFLPLLTV